MRGKKGDEHFDPLDPPRRRANKRRGRGTYENDRPPVLGVIGRTSGQVRLRVVLNTLGVTLEEHVHHSPCQAAMCTPMSTTATMVSTDHTQRYAMASKNGLAMMTVMASEKCIRIPRRACGLAYATSCAHFGVFISATYAAMLPCMSAASI